MKYCIGYQLPDELDSTYELCRDYREHIRCVYFSWGSEPSGRFPLWDQADADRESLEEIQLAELKEIHRLGIELNLLLNANCYGVGAVSAQLQRHVIKLVSFLKEEAGISRVTTTSPFLAETLKKEFGATLHIVASVNMRVGSIASMEQLSSWFDGFYLKKECNRKFDQIEQLSGWCKDHGKTLHLLANSGCLTDCAFQTFHDNLIAHQGRFSLEREEKEMKQKEESTGQAPGFPAPCHKYLYGLDKRDAGMKFLQSNWIPPQAISFYEPYFSEMKLATRMHARPRMVLAAYCRQRFTGNLLDLTEPSYSGLLKGMVLDSTCLPSEWFQTVSSCQKECYKCDYCRNTAKQIMKEIRFN